MLKANYHVHAPPVISVLTITSTTFTCTFSFKHAGTPSPTQHPGTPQHAGTTTTPPQNGRHNPRPPLPNQHRNVPPLPRHRKRPRTFHHHRCLAAFWRSRRHRSCQQRPGSRRLEPCSCPCRNTLSFRLSARSFPGLGAFPTGPASSWAAWLPRGT